MADHIRSHCDALDGSRKRPGSEAKHHEDRSPSTETHLHDSGTTHAEGGQTSPQTSHARHDDDNDDDGHYSTTASLHHQQHHADDSAPNALRSIPTAAGPDAPPAAPVEPSTSFTEVPDHVYDVFSPRRKLAIVMLMSFCAFLAPVSSTTVLSATPEVAAEFGTSGSVVDVSNALYLLAMGVSPIVWGPFSEVWGRKVITTTTAFLFLLCSIGTALAPNLATFFVFRILTAFEGTAFLLVGSACLQDIYRPTERATAMGWFLSGTLIGPALGPFIGGIIVTYTSWRVIFWVQTGLSAVAALGALVLLPETIHHKKYDDLHGMSKKRKAAVLMHMVNPWRPLKLMFTYPNLILAGLGSSSLVWNMYSLLTPIRYVLNPRFHLTTPLQSGLFYLAPGAGYLAGTFVGGRWADHVVKQHIARSPTHARHPEDRLRAALPFMGIAVPGCVLVYGWCVERDVGGVPLAAVMLFLQGVAQLFCFPSLNTYCLDVMQGRGSDVIAGNYFVRYLFACVGSAVVLPAVERVGVGWFSTVSAAFLVVSAGGVWAVVVWGRGWREAVDGRRRARRKVEGEKGKGVARRVGVSGGCPRGDVETARVS